VASTTLLLASLTASFENYDLKTARAIQLQWSTEGGIQTDVHIRALSLRRRLYYTMDTTCPAKDKIFQWPPDVLTGLNIPKAELGVVGFTRMQIDGADRLVYLPLRIVQSAAPVPSNGYEAAIMPGMELSEVFISLARERKGGKRQILSDGKPLQYGYYPAERAIKFPIHDPGEPGLYVLQVGATLKGGGVANLELYFLHRRL
jgi:hypothetical protein